MTKEIRPGFRNSVKALEVVGRFSRDPMRGMFPQKNRSRFIGTNAEEQILKGVMPKALVNERVISQNEESKFFSYNHAHKNVL